MDEKTLQDLIWKKAEVWKSHPPYQSAAERVGVHLGNMAHRCFTLTQIRQEIASRLRVRPDLENAYRLFMRPFGGLD